MPVHFYVTNNIIRDEPAALKAVSYVHVKGYTDGTKTVVITEEAVTDPNMTELSQADAQATVNAWLAEEAANGSPQDPLNLSVFLE